MRAVIVEQHGPPESCVIKDLPTPPPGSGEVLIDVHAIDVNYPDLLVIGGTYQILPSTPFSPGKQVAGVVAKVGNGVDSFKPGDRVTAQLEYGGYAEQIVAPAAHTYPMTPSISFVDAAAMGLTYQTAHFALIERGRFQPGETVLVTGASGGVGIAAISLVKALGGVALAGITKPAKAEAVRQAGADQIVDLAAADLRESLRRQIRDATDGHGADIVIDPVGGDVFDAALRALAWSGRIVIIGFAAGRIPEVKANYLLVKNLTATGCHWSDYRERTPEAVAWAQAEMFDLYEQGKIRPHVMATYPLERFADALDVIKQGQVVGKVVLTTGRD